MEDEKKAEVIEKKDSELKKKFDAWAREEPNNIGVKQWKHFIVSAKSPKMMSTIIMTASARLAPFNLREIERMTTDDTMELDRIGKSMNIKNDEQGCHRHGKVAYFIVTNPNDNAFNFLANLMYSQIFNIIDQNATENGGRLALPCNIWMDEFRQLGKIPNFLENWAYVRGLNCGITIILQSLSQFKKIYKDEWETGLDCCDYILFLGSRSKETLEYISQMLGKQTMYKKSSGRTFSKQGSSSQNWDVYGREMAMVDELAQLPQGYGILLMSGTDPFYSKLYDLTKDKNYEFMWEAWLEQDGEENKKIKESDKWKNNHAKLYDHLEEMKKEREEQLKTKTEIDTEKAIKDIGLKCNIVHPYEVVRNITSSEIKKQYGEKGFAKV